MKKITRDKQSLSQNFSEKLQFQRLDNKKDYQTFKMKRKNIKDKKEEER